MILDEFRLDGKVAIVTGGGTGLGKALARGLAEAGAAVALAGRRREPIEEARAAIEAGGGKAIAVQADVTDASSVEALMDQVIRDWSQLDILVNSAGILKKAPAEELAVEDFRQVIDINLTGTYLTSQAAARRMIDRRSGVIINLASVTSFVSLPQVSAYSASKGGVLLLTRSLANDWAKYGIRVNAIAPGFFPTELNIKALDENRRRKILEGTPLNRFGKAEELAPTAVYLASDASRFVTGTTVIVDGGFLAAGFGAQ